MKRNEFRGPWVSWVGVAAVALLVLLGLAGPVEGAVTITDVSVVNVTPSSFSVVWSATLGTTPGISVFADAGGVTNLAGTVGIEFYPLHTGAPDATNAYQRRLSEAGLRQKTINQGLVYARVTLCSPQTTYYYRLQATGTNGQTSLPGSGPLPAVTTAQENAFVIQSRQLVVNLPGIDPSGSIVILSNSNTPSLLAAVAGDGVASNEVFFSTSDLLAATGNTNYQPLGDQLFTATIMGSSSNTVAQTYSLNFTTDFLVGQEGQFSAGSFVVLSLGSLVLRAGDTVSVPVNLYASGITNFSFLVSLPSNRFSNLSLQGLSGQVGSATFQLIAPNTYRATLGAAAGQTLQGNQEIAQLNLTAVSNQVSAFLPLSPQALQAANVDGSGVTNFAAQAGRLTIVGNQPLLEAAMGANQTRSLTLYGKPGSSYQIQYNTNLANSAGWVNWRQVPLTNLVAAITGADSSMGIAFYRAYELNLAQPILQAEPGNVLGLYGAPGVAYEIDYATGLGFPINWHLLRRVPMTGSFQTVAGLNATNATLFYRAVVLNADPPALDARLDGQGRSVVVYGMPSTNYTLQYATNLSGTVAWQPLLSYTLSNSFQFVTNLARTNPVIFYRVRKP